MFSKPKLTTLEVLYYEIFLTLNISRPTGMVVGAIPISEVLAYLDLYSYVTLDMRVSILNVVRAVDAEWLKMTNKDDTKNADT